MHLRICCKCKKEMPATTEYFYKSGGKNSLGLRYNCKECERVENKTRGYKRQKKWKEENKEHVKEDNKQYKIKNIEKIRKQKVMQQQKREARKKQLSSSLTKEDWINCLIYFNHKCAYCGSEVSIQQEHFIPLNNGGSYTADNIIPACAYCNNSKHDKNAFEWYSRQKSFSLESWIKILKYLRLDVTRKDVHVSI